jgi:hypothetical protein
VSPIVSGSKSDTDKIGSFDAARFVRGALSTPNGVALTQPVESEQIIIASERTEREPDPYKRRCKDWTS